MSCLLPLPNVTSEYRNVCSLRHFSPPPNLKSLSKFLRSLMRPIAICETSFPLRTGHQIASPANTPGRVTAPRQVRPLADHARTSLYRKRGNGVVRHSHCLTMPQPASNSVQGIPCRTVDCGPSLVGRSQAYMTYQLTSLRFSVRLRDLADRQLYISIRSIDQVSISSKST